MDSTHHNGMRPIGHLILGQLLVGRLDDVAAMELNIERSEVGVESGILDRHQVSHLPRFVVVAMPETRRRDEGASCLPRDSDWIDQIPLTIDPFTD
jgi:hypothetical protein